MNRKTLILLAGLTLPAIAGIQAVRAQGNPEKPAVIVGIVVDGMRYDYIERYWNLLSEGGLKRLIRQGTVYTNASVPFLLADESSSHAAISTGAPPAINGIIADKWYHRLRREAMQSTSDYLTPATGTGNPDARHSASKLLSNTIGDQLILASNYKSKVISVAYRPSAAILLEGHLPGSAYWFDNQSGNWVTSSQYANKLPDWVVNFNSRNSAGNYLTREWQPMLADNLYEGCPPDDNDLEIGYYNQFKTFPYKLSRIRKESLGQENEILGLTPYGNSMTTDFATSALLEENLGKDSWPDILWISYTPLYQITKLFGPDSKEVADALLRLDMDLQRLLYQVEETVGKDKYLVLLTSSHGAAMNPEYSHALNLPGGFFRYHNAVALVNSYLTAIYGEGNWIENYTNHQVYLNETLIDQKGLSFSLLQDQTARFLTHFEGVARAIPADRLLSGQITSPWDNLVQNSYNPDRTGDILIILQPGWIEEENTDSDSRSPYTYDTHIPMIWYGWKVPKQSVSRPVTLIDIAPTLAHILNIQAPSGSTGNLLPEILR